MTGDEMKEIHRDLEEAIGRRLSVADMAKICGLAPKNGADTIRKWEDGDGPSGPVTRLLRLLHWASNNHSQPFDHMIDEIEAERLGFTAGQARIVMRGMMRREIVRRLGG